MEQTMNQALLVDDTVDKRDWGEKSGHFMELANYARAEASNLTKKQISALGESIATQLGYEPCGDIYEVVGKLGGSIEIEDTLLSDPESTGSLYVESKNSFRIIVPSHTSPTRDRFTIAHELGHFIVHYAWRRQKNLIGDVKMMALRRDSDRVEWEANWFAAAFLMSSTAFREKFEQSGGNINHIAAAFCVSSAAAEIRARSLGLT